MDEPKKYERRCQNWLTSFGEWTMPRSEAPENFIMWTGLFTLASVLKRHVMIPKGLLGSWSVVPNLYILFIAPAGKARKSTTANYGEDLLDNVPNITKAPEIVTKEDLLNKLVKSNDSSMCILSPEFGEFIVKSGTGMFGFLTNMFDGKKNISASTLSRGAEFAERPCINLLGATTPEWVAENMPESVIGGGFASRVIFVFEERVRRRKLWYDDLDWLKLNELQRDLIADLIHIGENISGEYTLTPEAKQFMGEWYDLTADDGDAASYKLSGYYERRPAHVMKVAILLHVAHSDTMILEKNDFVSALQLVQMLEKRLPKVFQNVGNNPHTVDVHRMLEYITEKQRVKKADVRRHFMNAATPAMLNELIEGLAAAGYIEMDLIDDEPWLSIVVATV
jgi:hypothetical protein